MIFIVLFIVLILGLALFPGTNTVVGAVDTTGWGTIQQGLHVVTPFLILFAVVICAIIFMNRRKG